jgi:hypothetical protein
MCKKCGANICANLATQELALWNAEKNDSTGEQQALIPSKRYFWVKTDPELMIS